MTCPKCGGEEWKMASVIHAEGLSSISALLSELAEPPTKEIRPAWIVVILAFFTFFLVILVGSLGIIDDYSIASGIAALLFFGSVVIFFSGLIQIIKTPEITNAINRSHKLALIEYEKKKMCLRCGTFFFDDNKIKLTQPTMTTPTKSSSSEINMKKCPFCAETIRYEAILCKHCHSKV